MSVVNVVVSQKWAPEHHDYLLAQLVITLVSAAGTVTEVTGSIQGYANLSRNVISPTGLGQFYSGQVLCFELIKHQF